jgi:hypothetical protein
MKQRANRILPVGIAPIRFSVSVNGQHFEVVRHEPYRRRDGNVSTLTIWHAECADCDASFTQTTAPNRWPEVRRCAQHRRPGHRATPIVRSHPGTCAVNFDEFGGAHG